MRIAQIVAPRKVVLKDVERPNVEPGKVLVRMEKVALCGSDLPHFGGDMAWETYPLLGGRSAHECIGIVEESEVPEFSVGDRALVFPPSQNGLTEYMVLPPEVLLKMPKDGDVDRLLMTQVLGTVVHCLRRMPSVVGREVVVLGQGPVGLLFDAAMRNLGARRIIGVDLLAYRLEVGRRMGATDSVDTGQEDPMAAVSELTNGRLADVAIEAVGKAETLNTCVRLLKHDGVLVAFGVPWVRPTGMDVNEMLRREIRMIASSGPHRERDHAVALAYIVQNRMDVSPMITHHLPFERIQEAYDMAYDRTDGVIKVIVEFG